LKLKQTNKKTEKKDEHKNPAFQSKGAQVEMTGDRENRNNLAEPVFHLFQLLVSNFLF
jgi:hypothetical protein